MSASDQAREREKAHVSELQMSKSKYVLYTLYGGFHGVLSFYMQYMYVYIAKFLYCQYITMFNNLITTLVN